PGTTTGLRCFTRAPRPAGLSRSGGTRRRFCSWPIGSSSSGRTAPSSQQIRGRHPSPPHLVTKRCCDFILAASLVHLSPVGITNLGLIGGRDVPHRHHGSHESTQQWL